MVYDQTRQNIIEKTNLLNTLLNNSDQITTNYLYYTKDIQDYLMTDQEPLSQDAVEELHQSLASHTALLLTDHNPEIAQVSLFTEPLPAKAGRFDLLLKQPKVVAASLISFST